jgi:hypothetical protein
MDPVEASEPLQTWVILDLIVSAVTWQRNLEPRNHQNNAEGSRGYFHNYFTGKHWAKGHSKCQVTYISTPQLM